MIGQWVVKIEGVVVMAETGNSNDTCIVVIPGSDAE